MGSGSSSPEGLPRRVLHRSARVLPRAALELRRRPELMREPLPLADLVPLLPRLVRLLLPDILAELGRESRHPSTASPRLPL